MKILIILILLISPLFAAHIISQNVGIGTSTPLEKLHVDGNVLMDTAKLNAILFAPNAGTGKILTSDDAGNANWEDLILPPPTNTSGNLGYGVWGDCATNGNIGEFLPVSDTTGSPSDFFGCSTSISDNFAIVGSFNDDGDAGINQGSVSVYQFDGTYWLITENLVDEDGEAGANFGTSVSISGNYAVVGAPEDDGDAGVNQGSVCFYQFDGSSWVLMQKITDSDGAMSDNFGRSVSISGNYAIIGSLYDDGPAGVNQGSVSIYQFDGTSWVLMEKIYDPDGEIGDLFGTSVSISGNYFVAGSPSDSDGSGQHQGSASIYQFDGSNWFFIQKITDAAQAQDADHFGSSVSISGNYVCIGAPDDDDTAGQNQGSVSIYHFNGSDWLLTQKFLDMDGSAEDNFGTTICISGNYAIIGSIYDDMGAHVNQGTASIYIRLGNTWQRLQKVIDPSGDANDVFGQGVAIDGQSKRFLIGATGYGPSIGKAIFGKIN
ncbi:MAG: FG-GAP repeat protein [Saprospiraceae bacterium]